MAYSGKLPIQSEGVNLMLKRVLPIIVAAALLLGGAVPAAAQDDETPSSGFTVTGEMIAQILAWLLENDPEQLLEVLIRLNNPPEGPDPEPESETERSPEETLSFWQQPGKIRAVDTQYACLVGSYHHTCMLWVNGADEQVACARAGCDPTR